MPSCRQGALAWADSRLSINAAVLVVRLGRRTAHGIALFVNQVVEDSLCLAPNI